MAYNLTLERVNEIFKGKNPTGYIVRGENWTGGKRGEFRVVFYAGGKVYTYKQKTLFSLCEKLDLVPERDIFQDAERIAKEFEKRFPNS